MYCCASKLFPVLLDMLGGGVSQEKREIAIWVLGKIIEGLGYIIEPHEQYSTLLHDLLGFLNTDQQPLVR